MHIVHVEFYVDYIFMSGPPILIHFCSPLLSDDTRPRIGCGVLDE